MKYMDQLNAFWRIEPALELSPQASYVYLNLLNCDNSLGWVSSLTLPESRVKGSLSHGTFINARKLLINKGLIKYRGRGSNKSAAYHIPELTDKFVQSLFDHTHDHTEDRTSDYKNDHTDDPYIRLDQTRPELIDIDAREEFIDFWRAYPKKQKSEPAFQAYYQARLLGVTKEQLITGAKNYAADIKAKNKGQGYVAMPDRWLLDHRWNDTYDLKPEKPKQASKPSFASSTKNDSFTDDQIPF